MGECLCNCSHPMHLDHSPAFWEEVERVVPDYQECKERLR